MTRAINDPRGLDDAPSTPVVVCGCCGTTCRCVYRAHPGYRIGTAYDLFHCSACDTSQASPLAVDVDVYDAIYAQVDRVPGYDRYVAYAQSVSEHPSPLDHLASLEDTYWAIREHLRQRPERVDELRVLDAGSGFGQLTYALARAGYDVRGVDVSEVAVARATAQFGGLYEHADVREFARTRRAPFDVVIMTEVIEHVPDASRLVSSVLKLLNPGGELLVTTPNKSSFSATAVWATENPPVHLWWFSEDSMRALARRLGSDVSFVDFSEFNRVAGGSDGFVEGKDQEVVPFYPPSLDASGRVMPTPRLARSTRRTARFLLEKVHLAEALVARRQRQYVRRGVSSRRWTMCASFSKPR